MSYNVRLRVENNFGVTKIMDLVHTVESAKVSGVTTDYKVVSGSHQKGILQGIGLLNTGREITFAVPLFDTDVSSAQVKFAEWSALMSSSYNNEFYLEQEVEFYENGIVVSTEWYVAKVQMKKLNGYTIKTPVALEGSSVTLIMIDNFYYSSTLESETINYDGNVPKKFDIISKSLVTSPINFVWTITSKTKTNQLSIQVGDGFGIKIIDGVDSIGEYTYTLQDMVLYRVFGTDATTAVIVDYTGVVPELDIGKTVLTVFSIYETISLVITYKDGVIL